ncbi:MAG: SDR family oxidoreductase [Deltaproteobacteria bacterium]|nr:MAG: SDR family oxidoreductase [Deltaproteobacteria bacterium]
MTPTYPDLKGRTALVTGASSGIGVGIAKALEGQGMRVGWQGNKQTPPGQIALQADLGTEQGCLQLAEQAWEKLGGVNLLVHSAGIWNDGPISSMSAAKLEEMFRVNTFSAFYLVRELLPASLHNIIFIGSTAGQRGEPDHSHYAASKGALQSLMMSLAVELAPEVRVNLVSPGWVRTPMTEKILQDIGPALIPTLPNQRVAEIEDVANAVLYLASDASSHLIGQDICVSGGALLVVPRGQLRPA